MNVTPVEIPLPAEYLPTGDHAMVVAWGALSVPANDAPSYTDVIAILCLEDGRAVRAGLSEIKFDYRYDPDRQRFVDVSGIHFEPEEGEDGEPDQEPPDHGSEGVPGLVSEADGAGEGGPGDEGPEGPRGLDPSEGSA